MSKVDPTRLREPAALVMLAVVVTQVLVMVERLLFGWEGSGFALRAAAVVTELSSPLLTALAVGSLLLATRFGDPSPRAGLIALGALGALGAATAFSLISLLGTLFSGLGARGVLETLLVAVPCIALMGAGLLYVLHLRTTLESAAPKSEARFAPAPPPAPEYGRPQQPAPAQPGHPQPGPAPAGHPQSGHAPTPVGALPPGSDHSSAPQQPAPQSQYGEQPAPYPAQQPAPQAEPAGGHHQMPAAQENPAAQYAPPPENSAPQYTPPQENPAPQYTPQQEQRYPSAQEQYSPAPAAQPQPSAAPFAPPQEQPGYGAQQGQQFGQEQYAPAANAGGYPPAGDSYRRPEPAESPLSAPAYAAETTAPGPAYTGEAPAATPAPAYAAEAPYSSSYGQGSYTPSETKPDLPPPAAVPYQTGQFLAAGEQQQSAYVPTHAQQPAAHAQQPPAPGQQSPEQGQQPPAYGGAAPGGQPFTGFSGAEFARQAEPQSYDQPSYDQPSYDRPSYDPPSYDRPSYEPRAFESAPETAAPYPDSTDPRQQQLAQAYQQAQSYQQQGYSPPADYAAGPQSGGYGQGYGGPLGHPQFPDGASYRPEQPSYQPEQQPQQPYQPEQQPYQPPSQPQAYQPEPQPQQQYAPPAAQPSWEDPLSDSTLRFDPVSSYSADAATGPQQPPVQEEPAIAPTAIYAPDRSAARVIPGEDSGRDRVGTGPDQGPPWYGSERRDR